MICMLEEQLPEADLETAKRAVSQAVFLTTERECSDLFKALSVHVEMETSLSEICFCKAESQQDCLYGTLAVPRILDVLGKRHQIAYVVTERYLIFIDNTDFTERMIRQIRVKRAQQRMRRERFLYYFMLELMAKDSVLLETYENALMDMEDEITSDAPENFLSRLQPLRKQLLTLRGYYDQLMDMARELEENEDRYFAKKQLKYFNTIADRAERQKDRVSTLLEYAQQVHDAYQATVDSRQNSNMQFLTVISTIFFPLTLITGWYGMNFENMPELKHGYPIVVLLSLAVLAICIGLFKKKKIL
ncbi:MAG: cobalt transporter [Clostridiales bacterium]|nr:cobalt transporter [Clostridiales bacterium]